MNIRQFRYSSDNLGYLVYSRDTAVAIDPGAVDDMTAFAQCHNVQIRFVTNTHSHADHTMGNSAMLHKTKAEFLDLDALMHHGHIPLGQEKIEVFHTPGHMNDCLTFHAGNALITGDTLFNGTVGTCFSGDMKGFLESIKILMSFDPGTLIYAGHDYVKESMAFARIIEKNNPHIQGYLEKYRPDHVVSTLADELKANPFLRFNDPAMIAVMAARGLPTKSELDRWQSLMDLY